MKLAIAIAVLVVVLVYVHEVGRIEGWQNVRAIDQRFAETAAMAKGVIRSLKF